MNKAELEKSIQNPSSLEGLYRKNPDKFVEIFPNVYEENSSSVILKVWHERLFYSDSDFEDKARRQQLILVTIIIALLAGFLVKIPSFLSFIKDEWYYPRYSVIFVLTGISAYFLFKIPVSKKIIIAVISAITAIILLSGLFPFPDKSDTFILSCMHFPLVSWSIFGFAFTGDQWKLSSKRIDFLRFNGELIIFTAIILLGGMVLTGLTLALFNLIDIKIEQWYMSNIVVMGLVASPIVATYIADSFIARKTRIAAVIARVFMPLFLVTVLIYLGAMFVKQKSPYSDRDFLITFNFLLFLVLSISIFSIIENKYRAASKIIEYTNTALILTTLIIDIIALSAILFRLSEFGITPNRIAVLGANLIIFIHLCGFLKPYIQIIRKNGSYSAIENWTAQYLPAYSIWSLIVAIGFPILFRFK
jgi:hypothetical protein